MTDDRLRERVFERQLEVGLEELARAGALPDSAGPEADSRPPQAELLRPRLLSKSLLLACAAAVVAGVFLLRERSAAPDGDAAASRESVDPNGGENQDPTQDPDLSSLSVEALIDQLRDAGTRGAATRELVRRNAGDAVLKFAIALEVEEDGEFASACFAALHLMRERADALLQQLARTIEAGMSVPQCALVVAAMAELAPWATETVPSCRIKSMSLPRVSLEGGGVLAAGFLRAELNQLARASSRLRERRRVRRSATVSELGTALLSKDSRAREAALELIAERPRAEQFRIIPALARGLRTDHPDVELAEWVDQQTVRMVPVEYTQRLHSMLSEIVLRVDPFDIAAVDARVHLALHGPKSERAAHLRRLGVLLPEHAKKLGPAETGVLLDRLAGLAEDSDPVAAGAAVSAIAAVGRSASILEPLLQRLSKSVDVSLARRARAALAAVRGKG